jgi:hypothetical protein
MADTVTPHSRPAHFRGGKPMTAGANLRVVANRGPARSVFVYSGSIFGCRRWFTK